MPGFLLRAGTERQAPLGPVFVWHDRAGTATLEGLVAQRGANFTEAVSAVPNFGREAGVCWLRIDVRSEVARRWLFEVDSPYIDSMDVYLVAGAERVVAHSGTMGWRVPPIRRAVPHRNLVFGLPLQPGVPYTLYVRAHNTGLLKVPVAIWDERAFWHDNDLRGLAWGVFAGTQLFVALLGLFLRIAFRDRTYAYFSLYTFFSLCLLLVLEGWAVHFVAEAPEWLVGTKARPLFLMLSVLALLKFSQSYLGIRLVAFPRLYWTLQVLAGAMVVFLAGVFLHLLDGVPVVWRLRIINGLSMLMLTSIVATAVGRLWGGYRPALFYLAALLPFVGVGVGEMAQTYGLLPDSWLFANGLPFALVVQVVVLCLGLVYRFKLYKKESESLLVQINDEQQRTFEALLAAKEQEARRLKEEVHGLEMHTAHQAERERIARDLHDNVGSQLTFIISNLDYIAHQSTRPDNRHLLVPSLEEVGQHARETMHLLRDTLWAVHKESITTGELAKRLQAYVGQHFRQGGQVHLRLQKDLLLKPGHALSLFRIVQEALANSLKHAQAATVQLYVSLTAQDEFILQIADDGAGFDLAAHTPQNEGYGLANMRKRAEGIGAAFEMQSAAGRGTTVTVRMCL